MQTVLNNLRSFAGCFAKWNDRDSSLGEGEWRTDFAASPFCGVWESRE